MTTTPVAGTWPLYSDLDVSAARQAVRDAAAAVGFSLVDQTKLVTAASELARNALVHGGGGHLTIGTLQQDARTGIRLTVTDSGPGIPDVELALTDGYSTGDGLGLGLGGSRRLVHEFAVESAPGKGTTVVAVSWNSSREPGR